MTLSALLRIAGLVSFILALLILVPGILGPIGWAGTAFFALLGLALWLASLVIGDLRQDRDF